MVRIGRIAVALSTLSLAAACASATGTSASASAANPSPNLRAENANGDSVGRTDATCTDCAAATLPADITRAVESRIADLKARGGDCSRYAAVLETSYRSGQITLRPFMWRVGAHLASGEAKPNGDMTLAREIDSLNVGVRTMDDLMRTMEHEAVHIAFNISSGDELNEARVNAFVRECATAASVDAAKSHQRSPKP
jgi:hypothetical protein